jgi:hypothetical protein
MPPKKKSKPSFKVPEDLESVPQAGWVYRSESTSTEGKKPPAAADAAIADEPARGEKPEAGIPKDSAAHKSADFEPSVPPASPKVESTNSSSSGILDLTAKTLSSGMATIGNALMLGAAILTAPLRIGLWLVGIRGRD